MIFPMQRIVLPRHFVASGFLVLFLASLYTFFEANRLREEFLQQAEDKAAALAEAMVASVSTAVVLNTNLESQIERRLLDNARSIDQRLLTRRVDQARLKEFSAINRLGKIDFLDPEGQPLELAALPATIARENAGAELLQRDEQTISYMWGKRWLLPEARPGNRDAKLPPRITGGEFWKSSAIGAAVGARSFPGIIAVHANADYVLNFEKEIGFQHRIIELGRAAGAEFVALLDTNLNVVAHTDPSRIGQQEKEPQVSGVYDNRQRLSKIVLGSGGKRHLEVVKPIVLYQSIMGFLKIGLSLEAMDIAWYNSLRAIVILSLTVFAAGILGMAAIFHNQNSYLQQLKALEIEVLQRERLSAMGNLSAAVAHEIRNPLNAISMGLQRLKMEFQPTVDRDQYSRLTELMLGEAHRLNSIVEEFLSLARPVKIKAEALPVPEILKELAALQESRARESNVQIQINAARNLPPLSADPSHLTQVLLNLMLNGLQAMPEGGTLTLEAKTSNGNFLIAVTDTGSGIAPDNLPRIFEPYFTTSAKGTGLGLAISRGIIEDHGGRITVTSKVGQGARFEISLPLNGAEV
jgi:signal transduction histidine kinase